MKVCCAQAPSTEQSIPTQLGHYNSFNSQIGRHRQGDWASLISPVPCAALDSLEVP